jgi:hypothetical protein
MSTPYTDPKDFAMHISGEFLAEFLKKEFSIDFLVVKDEKSEQTSERFIDKINDHADRDKIFVALEGINEVSSARHIDGMYTRSILERKAFDLEDYKRCKNYDERALWWFMNDRAIFDQYREFNDLEDLSGAKEIIIPVAYTKTSDEIIDKGFEELEKSVSSVYTKSLRGEKCKAKYWKTEVDGTLIIRAYLEDLPTGELAFEGDEITSNKPHRPVFSVVYIYNPSQRMLGVKAIGGAESVESLQEIFCKLFLGCTLDQTEKRAFDLTNISDIANVELVTDPSDDVEQVYLKAVELRHKSGVAHSVRVDVGGKEKSAGTDGIKDLLGEIGLNNLSQWEVKKIELKFIFRRTLAVARKRQITVRITPDGCSLKQRKEDKVIRGLLQKWGFAK